jgi:predicted RNA-binding Zn ribbon-like protein
MKRADKSQAFARPSRAGSLDLVGGALALDLTNTSSGRGTPGHQEHLRDFDTVMQWVAHAGILTPGDCAYIRAAAASRPKLAREFFERLLEIRELVWMIATALAEQRPVAEKLRAALTAAHAESLRHAEIKMRDGVFIWVWDPRRDIQAAILGPITLSALTLLMEKDLSRTKCCAGQECGWLFFDTTKNKRRRWCEMRVCGNRAKVRAARARKKVSGRG